jgi:hypothetical protein
VQTATVHEENGGWGGIGLISNIEIMPEIGIRCSLSKEALGDYSEPLQRGEQVTGRLFT